MVLDLTNVAFLSSLKYMRKYEDYEIAYGGGSVSHNLGYIPFFLVFAEEVSSSALIPIRTGNVYFPSGDLPFFIVNATATQVTVTEDIPPIGTTNYTVRVYEDPLP
jgi:hypothetical protein